MKKITESQLKNRVNGLREYMVSLAEVAFSSEQQAKMGKANPQDPYIVARVLGKDAVPLSHFTDPEDQKIAKQMGFKDGPAALAPTKMRGSNPAAAPAAAPGLGLKSPNSGGFAASLPPADGSDDRRVNGQGLKLPAQTPVTSVAAAQAALGAEDNPEAAMGAGSGAAPVAANKPASEPAAAVAPAAPNPYDIFKKADGSPAAPPGFKPPPPGVIWSEPAAGEQATKVARFKELIAKAKELRTDAEVQASKDLGSFAGESTTYFLNKLRLIESRQLNEVLTPEEQKLMDELAAELGQEGAESDPELVAAINDYNSLKNTPATAYSAQAPTASAPPPAPPAAQTFNAAKDSQKSNVTSISTEVRAISDALGKLDPANTTQAELQPLFDRIKKVQADASGAGADVNAIVQPLVANAQDELKQAMAAVNNASAGAVVDPTAAKNPYAGVKWAYVPGDGTVAGSAKMAADAAAAAKNTSASTGVGNPGEEAAAQVAADKAAQANQAAAVRPPVAVDPRDGAVGQSLAKMGVSKQDRLDQKFVDSTLGAGHKAGSAESNMALQAHFKKQAGGSGAPVTPAAGAVPASASLAPGEKIMPNVPKLNATGGAKAVAGLNQEPIKFPGNGRAAKTVTPVAVPAKPAPVAAPAKPAPVATGSGGGRGPTAQEFTNDWNNKMKAAQKLGWPDSTKLPPADWAPMGKPVTGKNKMAPDLKEAVTYADDQTLARIVSLSRR